MKTKNKINKNVVELPAYIKSGVLFTKIDGKEVLLDTGSPCTIGDVLSFSFFGKEHKVVSKANQVSTGYLTGVLDTHVDMLMGTDIMDNYYLTVDLPQKKLYFSTEPILEEGIRIPIAKRHGTPKIKMNVNEKEVDVYFDTGARMVYLDKEWFVGMQAYREESDFWQPEGNFITPVYKLPVTLSGDTKFYDAGITPPQLSQSLRMMELKGLLGAELFEHYQVSIAFPEQTLVLQPHS